LYKSKPGTYYFNDTAFREFFADLINESDIHSEFINKLIDKVKKRQGA